jgi:hypothetical protein
VQNAKQALTIGSMWVIFTVIFEFSLGRLTGKSWSILFEQYHVASGQLWPIFLIGLLVLPSVLYAFKR